MACLSAIVYAQADIPQLSPLDVSKVLRMSPMSPLPDDPTNKFYRSATAAVFGKLVFFDPRFSSDGKTSCATCHDPARAWSDGGNSLKSGRTSRRAPTLLNVAYQRWFFWDGRSDSLWAQATGPLENENENGCHRLKAYLLIANAPDLRDAYTKAFGPAARIDTSLPMADAALADFHRMWRSLVPKDRDNVNVVFVNLSKAIAAFERTITSTWSRFDDFVESLRLAGKTPPGILSASAIRGLALFIGKANCINCHHGPQFSDLEFHNIQLPDRGLEPAKDSGRYGGIQLLKKDGFNSASGFSDAPAKEVLPEKNLELLDPLPEFWGQFKTPSLRNLAGREPYMHNARFSSLREVVSFYSTLEGASKVGHHDEQVLQPLHLSSGEQLDLIAFLESLNATAQSPK